MGGFFPFGDAPSGALSDFVGPGGEDVTVNDGAELSDVPTKQWVVPIFENTSTVSDAMTETLVYALREAATCADTATGIAKLTAILSDQLALDDRLIPVLQVILADATTLSEVLTGDPIRTVALRDALLLSDTTLTSVSALAILTDTVAITALLASVVEVEISDASAFADALTAQASYAETLAVGAVLSESLQGLGIFTVLASDGLEIGDSITGLANYLVTLRDEARVALTFDFAGERYTGLVMNAATRALTTYSGLDFNSLAVFNGVLYGAGEGGLYRLEGDDDDGTPITATLRTALTKIGTGKLKRVSAAYLGVTTTGRLILKVIACESATGDKGEYWYELAERDASAPRTARIKLGRGLKATYYALEMVNGDGADFDLDSLHLLPLALDRRI